MGDFKSKLPSFKELHSMSGKLFDGLKKSINDIVVEYKRNRESEEPVAQKEPTTTTPTVKKEVPTEAPAVKIPVDKPEEVEPEVAVKRKKTPKQNTETKAEEPEATKKEVE
jgi:hypothetical protein